MGEPRVSGQARAAARACEPGPGGRGAGLPSPRGRRAGGVAGREAGRGRGPGGSARGPRRAHTLARPSPRARSPPPHFGKCSLAARGREPGRREVGAPRPLAPRALLAPGPPCWRPRRLPPGPWPPGLRGRDLVFSQKTTAQGSESAVSWGGHPAKGRAGCKGTPS